MKPTAFPEYTIVPDPLTEADHTRAWRTDPSTAEETIQTPVSPEFVSSAFVPPQANERRRDLYEQPESAIHYEQGFRWAAWDVEQSCAAGFTHIEIARWHVPAGNLGIISHIDTHFGLTWPIEEADANIRTFEIAFDHPEQPFLIDSLYSLKYGDLGLGNQYARSGVRWMLRIESKQEGRPGNPESALYYQGVPGSPYSGISEWTDQRFAWGRGREPLRLVVPESHTVRLWVGTFSIPVLGGAEQDLFLDPFTLAGTNTFQNVLATLGIPTTYLAINTPAAWSRRNVTNVAGRIIGTLQSTRDNPEAQAAARRGLS